MKHGTEAIGNISASIKGDQLTFLSTVKSLMDTYNIRLDDISEKAKPQIRAMYKEVLATAAKENPHVKFYRSLKMELDDLSGKGRARNTLERHANNAVTKRYGGKKKAEQLQEYMAYSSLFQRLETVLATESFLFAIQLEDGLLKGWADGSIKFGECKFFGFTANELPDDVSGFVRDKGTFYQGDAHFTSNDIARVDGKDIQEQFIYPRSYVEILIDSFVELVREKDNWQPSQPKTKVKIERTDQLRVMMRSCFPSLKEVDSKIEEHLAEVAEAEAAKKAEAKPTPVSTPPKPKKTKITPTPPLPIPAGKEAETSHNALESQFTITRKSYAGQFIASAEILFGHFNEKGQIINLRRLAKGGIAAIDLKIGVVQEVIRSADGAATLPKAEKEDLYLCTRIARALHRVEELSRGEKDIEVHRDLGRVLGNRTIHHLVACTDISRNNGAAPWIDTAQFKRSSDHDDKGLSPKTVELLKAAKAEFLLAAFNNDQTRVNQWATREKSLVTVTDTNSLRCFQRGVDNINEGLVADFGGRTV